jgi:uncharacterized ferredoxin-like protein
MNRLRQSKYHKPFNCDAAGILCCLGFTKSSCAEDNIRGACCRGKYINILALWKTENIVDFLS